MSLTTKLPVFLLVSLLSHFSFGQKYFVNKKKKSYFGLTGGVNLSIPKVIDQYSVLSSTSNPEKEYDKLFENRGVQFGVRYSYSFTNAISVLAGFQYQSVGFNYFTNYSWADTVNGQNLDREMHHLQKVSYFSLPIMARWDVTTRQLMPYVQAGIFMDFRHQAKKAINYDNIIDGEVTEAQSASSAEVSIKDYTRKFNMGLTGGIGLRYHSKYVTFGLESNFRYGFFKLVNDDVRYSDLNGFALQYLDVLDQLKLSNLNAQLTVSIPIDQAVSTNILRRKRYRKRR